MNIGKGEKAKDSHWRPRQKIWEMRYDDVIELALESRVVKDERRDIERELSIGIFRYADIDIYI